MPQLSYQLFSDSLLESREEWELERLEAIFKEKKGTLFVDETVELKKGDAVYPACSAAKCRSQTLYILLKQMAKGQYTIHPPHACRRGYDPYNGEVQIGRAQVIEDEFEKAFHKERVVPFGFERSHLWEKVQPTEIKKYYDRHYFGPNEATRRVYIAFRSNVHVMLKRLNETNEDLKRVALLAIPLDDEITHPSQGLKSGSVEAYLAFFDKIRSYFIKVKENLSLF